MSAGIERRRLERLDAGGSERRQQDVGRRVQIVLGVADVHGPLAMAMPGLRRYVQNFVEPDDRRDPPWDVIVEMWFDDRAAMEAAWRSEAGSRASADNANCLDLKHTRWSVVDEIVIREED